MIRPLRLTYSDLEAFPNDGIRRELVGGELLMTPAPSPRHQTAVLEIAIAFHAYTQLHGGKAFVAPVDVVFEPHNVLEPDVVLVPAGRLSIISERAIFGVPSLVAEVLSPSTTHDDRNLKRDIYARYEVPEYWIADPVSRSVERYSSPVSGTYTLLKTFTDIVTSSTIDDLTFDLSKL